jgi:homoserine kinase
MKRATAFAPASVGNVAVGFDILGHSIDGLGDHVTVTRAEHGEVRIVDIRGVQVELPREAQQNTAGRALLALQKWMPSGIGFDVEIEKGIPLGSGLGGSAASAVAAVVAANAVLEQPVTMGALYQAAMMGESASTGAPHGDNVGPMLLGGLVIAPSHGSPVKVSTPPGLWVALVHPHFVLETRRARAALSGSYAIHEFVAQSENLALVLTGCLTNDFELIRRGLRDVLVEPRRAALIPGFAEVKRAALEAGALGASISGAGPTVFGWFDSRERATQASLSMASAFQSAAALDSDCLVSAVAGPAAKVVS